MPRVADGVVERPDPNTQARFVRLAMPARKGARAVSAHGRAIESLKVGGDAYIIPLNGDDEKTSTRRARSLISSVAKRTGGGYAQRTTAIDGVPVVGVWRVR